MIFVGIIIGLFFGLVIGDGIGGHVAYEEGIDDERRQWYIHAHFHGHDPRKFEKGKSNETE